MSAANAHPPRRHVLGIELDAVTMDQAVARCAAAVDSGQTLIVGCVNAAKVVKLRSDSTLRDAVASCDLIVSDGMPLVWASRLLGQPLPERVTGIDLFVRLLRLADDRRLRIYLLGARQHVVEKVVASIRREYPRIVIGGYRNGYFGEAEDEAMAAAIRDSHADILFLGITSPRKELFLRRFGTQTGVAVAHGVGGSFDVLAREVKRAPLWMQRSGLEWLFRVFQEPRRMWKRYLTTNTRFLLLLVRELALRLFRRRTDARAAE